MEHNALKEQDNFKSNYFVQNKLDWRVRCANRLNKIQPGLKAKPLAIYVLIYKQLTQI